MAEKRVCDGCKKEYWWPGAKWQHARCGDGGSASRKAGSGVKRTAATVAVRARNDDYVPPGDAKRVESGDKKQGWDRTKYNAYQKALMRERRK